MRTLLLLLFTTCALYGQTRSVVYSPSTRAVAQTNLFQGFDGITNHAATASEVASYDTVKKLVSIPTTGAGAAVLASAPTLTSPLVLGSITMEGSSVDNNENTVGTTNPTDDHLTLFPDAGGTVMVSEPTDAPTNGQLPYYVTATTNYQHASFGLGITNSSGTISNNIVAGANVTITAGSNGQLSIASTGGGGSAPTGTMVNTGNNIVGGIPVASDTTDTNYVPSSVTINAGTNLLAGTVHGTNQVSGGRFLGTGTTADSRIDVPDDDGSAYAGFQAADTTTTAVNLIFPAAPFTGVAQFTASGTNWTASAALVQFSGPSTLRTITVPDASFTAARTDAANTFTGIQSITQIDLGSTGSSITEGGAGYLLVEGVQIVMPASTNTFTNKTLDAAGTGNVLKQTKQLNLQRPDYGDGAGAVPQTNTYTASGLMHYTLSGGTAETNANWIVYEFDCPSDLDTGVEMTARFAFLSGGTDTSDYTFHITYAQQALGAAYVTGTSIASLPIVMTVTPTTPASGDLQSTAAVTLTGWAAALTPGAPMQVRIAKPNDAQDDSARDVQLVITYGSTL